MLKVLFGLAITLWAGAIFAEQLPCNGLITLCDRKYNEATYPATHNSMSAQERGFMPPNHIHTITKQLEAGIRGLLLDIHPYKHSTYLCHGSCKLGYQSAYDGLLEIYDFMVKNPREVITLIFENFVSAEDLVQVFEETGLIDFVATLQVDGEFSTLGSMIDSGKRLVVFIQYASEGPDWLHYRDDYVFAPHWNNPTPEDLKCEAVFGNATNSLYDLSHFVMNPISLKRHARRINFNPFLIDRAWNCMYKLKRRPNFITVDFYSIGDLFDAVYELNMLRPEDFEHAYGNEAE